MTRNSLASGIVRRARLFCLGLCALALGPVGSAVGGEESGRPVLTFGVAPQQSASELAKAWTPILGLLGEKSGYVLRFATAKDISTFEQRLAAGAYDVAYMNPYAYTVFHRAPGYRLLAKEQGRTLQGIVVVRKSAATADIASLRGQTVAFADPMAFAATLLVQAELAKRGVAVLPKYVANHDSVYLAVARGLAAAGGGIPRTFEKLPAETREQLRILWRTAAYPPHAFAAHPRLSEATTARLQAALTGMADDPKGAELLQALGFQRLAVARDGDYDAIRRLDIRPPALSAP